MAVVREADSSVAKEEDMVIRRADTAAAREDSAAAREDIVAAERGEGGEDNRGASPDYVLPARQSVRWAC